MTPEFGGVSGECQKPGCADDAEETYSGPHDNSLRLCASHYYRLVTRGRSISNPVGVGVTLTPLRESAIGTEQDPERIVRWGESELERSCPPGLDSVSMEQERDFKFGDEL